MNRKVSGNISKLLLLRILGCSFLYVPITVLLLEEHGLPLSQIFFLKSFLSVVFVLLEIPSGYLADQIGRRVTLFLGGVACMGSMLCYCVAESFAGFLLAELFLGIGWSLISGADVALMYDSLIMEERVTKYKLLEGKFASAASFSEAFGGLIGGVLAAISLELPFAFQALIFAAYAIIALTLVEAHTIEQHSKTQGQRLCEFIAAVRYTLIDHLTIRWLALYIAVNGSATFAIVWFAQTYMKQVGVAVGWFGVIWMLLHLWLGLVSLLAHRTEEILGTRTVFYTMTALVGIGFIALAAVDSELGVAILFMFYLARGLRMPITRDYLNRLIPSEIRATALSTASFLTRIVFVTVTPLLGWYADLLSLSASLALAGGLFSVLGAFALLQLERVEFFKNAVRNA